MGRHTAEQGTHRARLAWLAAWFAVASGTAAAQGPGPELPAVRITASRGAADDLIGRDLRRLDIDPDAWPGAGAARLEDLLTWTGLGTPGPSATPDLSTNIQLRGFVAGAEPGTGLGSARIFLGPHPDIGRRHVRDLFTVEGVSLLQGPDATLGGIGNPSGLIQYQPKTASRQPATLASLGHDSSGLWRAALDLNRPVGGPDSGLSTRLVGVLQRGGHTAHGVRSDRQVLLWTSRWQDGGQVLDLSLEEQINQQPFGFGTVHAGGQFRWDQVYADTERSRAQRIHRRWTLQHSRDLGRDGSLRLWWNTAQTQREETLSGFFTVLSPTRLSGYWREIDESSHQRNLGASLEGRWIPGHGVGSHDWQVRWQHNSQNLRLRGPQSIGGFSLDVERPDFQALDPSALVLTPRWWLEQAQDQTLSVRDRLTLGAGWRLDLGLSRTWSRIDSVNSRTVAAPTVLARISETGWTARAATLQWERDGHRLWAGHGMGVEPNRGLQRDGSPLPALQASQWELGWRQAAPGTAGGGQGGLSPHLVLWRNQQRNLAGPDPLDPTALAPIGAVRGEGLQAGLQREGPDWQLLLQWQRQRVRTTTPASASVGPWLAGVPDQWASGRIGALRWPGRPWVAAHAVGRRPGDSANSFQAPGHVLLDLGAGAALAGGWSLQGSIRNLLDTRHIASLQAADLVWQGPGRRAALELRGSW